MNFEDIKLLKLSDGVVSLALNRPGKRNALSENMIKELVTAINIIDKDKDCRLIKLEGEGEVFCAGGDLEWMKEQANSTREKRINEAKGKAREIALLAHATAEGIKVVSKAISNEGGRSAVKLNLVEQFIEEVGLITSSAEVTVVPKELANIKGMFEGFKNIAASKEL